MKCLYPLNVKYDKDFNGSNYEWFISWRKRGFKAEQIPPYTLKVPCGKCINCLRTLRNAWSFRLIEQLDHSDNAYFITLTYEDRFLPKTLSGIETLDKIQLRAFLDTFRYKYGSKSFKYFAVGEYGGLFGRPHYHCIFFNVSDDMDCVIKSVSTEWFYDNRTSVYKLNAPLINYTTKYIIKPYDELKEGQLKPFRIMSRGLGSEITLKQSIDYWTNKQGYIQKGYVKYSPPRYIRDKLLKRLITLDEEELKDIHKMHTIGSLRQQFKRERFMQKRGWSPRSSALMADEDYFGKQYLSRNDIK